MKWVGSCVVLYNLLLDLDDDIEARWEMPEEDGSHEDEEEISECANVGRKSEGKKKRNAMMREVVAEERDY